MFSMKKAALSITKVITFFCVISFLAGCSDEQSEPFKDTGIRDFSIQFYPDHGDTRRIEFSWNAPPYQRLTFVSRPHWMVLAYLLTKNHACKSQFGMSADNQYVAGEWAFADHPMHNEITKTSDMYFLRAEFRIPAKPIRYFRCGWL